MARAPCCDGRYGYAALRVLRSAIRFAIAEHRRRTLDPAHPYAGDRELASMRVAYNRAVRAQPGDEKRARYNGATWRWISGRVATDYRKRQMLSVHRA